MSIASRSRRPLLEFGKFDFFVFGVFLAQERLSRYQAVSCLLLKRTTAPGLPGTVAVWINRSVIKLRRVCTCSVLARLNNQTITLLDFFHYHIGTGVVNARQAQQGLAQ